MKTLLSSDWHLTDNPRDAYRWKVFSWIRKLILDRDIDRFICLGDITEAKDWHSAVLTNAIADLFRDLTGDVDFYVVPGNHDASDPDHPFFEFVKYAGVKWIRKPSCIADELFLPHTRNYLNDWKPYKGRYTRAYCHNTFQGATNEFGKRMDGIPTEALSCPVFSGDIHAPQTVDNITFVGAPYHVRFGDKYEPRVIILNGNKVESVSVPGPKKFIIEVDGNNYRRRREFGEGDMIRFKVMLEHQDIENWPTIQASLRKSVEDSNAILDSIIPIVDYKLRKKTVSNFDTKTDAELIQSISKRHQLDSGTIKVGLSFIEENE